MTSPLELAAPKVARPPRCHGIFGWMFGHDWTAWTIGSGVIYRRCDYCGYVDTRPAPKANEPADETAEAAS